MRHSALSSSFPTYIIDEACGSHRMRLTMVGVLLLGALYAAALCGHIRGHVIYMCISMRFDERCMATFTIEIVAAVWNGFDRPRNSHHNRNCTQTHDTIAQSCLLQQLQPCQAFWLWFVYRYLSICGDAVSLMQNACLLENWLPPYLNDIATLWLLLFLSNSHTAFSP